jgi:hypothetical protein
VIIHRTSHLLVPLLALSVTFAMLGSVRSASGATDVSIQINFGTSPHWVGVQGTHVQAIRPGDRTDYDMFHYGRFYYVYNHNDYRWYRSRTWRGRFLFIDERSLPGELRRVPRRNWRNYPSAWSDQGRGPKGTPPGLENKGGIPPGQEKKGGNPPGQDQRGGPPGHDKKGHGR